MARYISKLQYKTYETSEFTSIASRNFEEVMELIHNFPWEAERPLTPVGLTGPSVTIEDENGNYLKISLYYNNKFCFYFLSTEGKLYRKIILKIAESEEVIAQFYQNETPLHTFQLQSSWRKQTKYFVTNTFEYMVCGKRLVKFTLSPMLIFAFFILLVSALTTHDSTFFERLTASFFLFIFINFLFIFRHILTINYWLFCESLYLKVTKGQNIFYFGSKFDPKEYNKLDISTINIYQNTGRKRNIISDCMVYELVFASGETIIFPSLLIDEDVFNTKFSRSKMNTIYRWYPTVKDPM